MGLKEIAEVTGYSISTVSRVLNSRQKRTSTRTEKEIWAAAQKLHYVRNSAAVDLKKGPGRPSRIFRIGIIMARGPESLEDEFYLQIESSAKAAVLRAGHQLGETFMLQEVLDHPRRLAEIDGLILLGKCAVRELSLIHSACKYLTCTGLNPYYLDLDQVYCNGELIARAAVRHFLSQGHMKIGYVGECNDVRYFGYRQAVEGNELNIVSSYVFDVPQTEAGGRQAAEQYVLSQDPPTAMFCVNDVSAIGLMDTLKKLQPDRPLPAVMGIGDISAAVDQQPSLTTAQLPLAEMGNIAARTLLDRMTGKHAISMKIELPYKLIHRQSTPDL